MAYSTITKPADYFNTVLYTGDGNTTQAITGVGFQPDWLWIKHRNGVSDHQLSDIVRGKSGSLYYQIQTNGTSAQSVQPDNDGVHSLDSDGFTVGYTNSTAWNQNSSTYVAWNWLGANGTSANTDGTISSTVSANTTSGFSVLTYSGSNSNSSVGHGLGVAPKVIIIKNRTSGSTAWFVGHDSLGWTKKINLQDTAAAATYNGFQDTAPTSSVFTLTGNILDICQSGSDYVAYCFAEKKGFSKFGSYTGNGNADGTFVYTGFKPAFVITKRTSTLGTGWVMMDNKRETTNDGATNYLLANDSVAETSASFAVDFLSNGFKPRTNSGGTNTSGATYIYMAFAENPLVGTNNIPATAR